MHTLSRHKWMLILATVPIVMNTIAFVAFRRQGGFGGGHGRYDAFIYCLEYPGIIAVDRIPDSFAAHLTDLTLILMVPFLVNIGLAVVLGAVIDWAGSGRVHRAPPRGFDVEVR